LSFDIRKGLSVKLTEQEKKKIIGLIETGKKLPAVYKSKLFSRDDTEFIEATKDYHLVYKGKARKENIIAQTPLAPFQKIRSFCSDNSFEDNWQNMLIFGDNLLALKTLYEDQRGKNLYKTKNKIKLIYIDPPFATKHDFMKDREKAYRDKIIGSQFIEFLRKRLFLMREILADDGSIYVHLDWKKGHYIKAIMDEIFGEHNFRNEIIWKRTVSTGSSKSIADKFPILNDSIYYYTKSNNYIFNTQFQKYSKKYIRRYTEKDENGFFYWDNLKTYSKTRLDKLIADNRIKLPLIPGKNPRFKNYLHEGKGVVVDNILLNIPPINSQADESKNYPTQKPEKLIELLLKISSDTEDIVLDAFAGSGTTLSVAEKLKRRWIGMECGKLAIYTTQKRMLNLTTQIGSFKKDERRDYERVSDFEEHSKSNSRGLIFIYEKARRGDLVVTDSFLKSLSDFLSNHLAGNKKEEFSLICPEDKLKLKKIKPVKSKSSKAGEKIIDVGKVRFLISVIQPKEKTEKVKPFKAREFTLFHAGVYDAKAILDLDWKQYKPFVAQLFSVRQDRHKIHGFEADGYIGVHSAFIWDYPNQKNHLLDHGYIKSLHTVLGGKAGSRFYVIAPISSMGFMEDEIELDSTTYVLLKVPLSVLKALIEKGDPGSLKQPVSELDVNKVIDAVGFDFISKPEVNVSWHRRKPVDHHLFNNGKLDWSIEISSFRSNTLAYDPDDFENFETLSMVLIDTDYNDDYFNLCRVFWAGDIINKNRTKAVLRLPKDEYTGKKLMVIFIDTYGNELKVVKTKKDFK
jgi:DNA modification methylase